MAKSLFKPHIVLLCSTLLFALNIPLAKSLLVSGDVHPVGLTMMRFLAATAGFWILSFFLPHEQVRKADHLKLFFCALLGVSVNQLLFIIGLANTSPVDASIIITLSPVFVMLMSAVALKEPVTSKKVFGVFLGACGAVLIILSSHHNHAGASSWWANLLIFSTTLTYAGYLVLMKPLTETYSTATLMKWIFLYGTLATLPFCYKYIYIQSGASNFTYWGILYTTVGATFLAYLLVPIALKVLRPTIVGMYNYAQPVIASFVALTLGQDLFSWEKPVSLALVFAGVYFVIISKSRAQVLAEKAEQGHA